MITGPTPIALAPALQQASAATPFGPAQVTPTIPYVFGAAPPSPPYVAKSAWPYILDPTFPFDGPPTGKKCQERPHPAHEWHFLRSMHDIEGAIAHPGSVAHIANLEERIQNLSRWIVEQHQTIQTLQNGLAQVGGQLAAHVAAAALPAQHQPPCMPTHQPPPPAAAPPPHRT